MTWDAAYYYCKALSKIEGSGITGMAKLANFKPLGASGSGWLNILATGATVATSTTTCNARTVSLSSGEVVNANRCIGDHYALCE